MYRRVFTYIQVIRHIFQINFLEYIYVYHGRTLVSLLRMEFIVVDWC